MPLFSPRKNSSAAPGSPRPSNLTGSMSRSAANLFQRRRSDSGASSQTPPSSGDLSTSSPARGSSSSGRPRAPTDEMFAHGVQLMQESLGDSLPADKCLELLRATDGNVTVAINLFLDGGAGDVDSRLPSFEAARSFPIAPPPSALGLYQRGLDRSAAELDELSHSAELSAPAPAATPTPAPTVPTATPQPERDDSSGRVEDAIAEITAQNVAEMTAMVRTLLSEEDIKHGPAVQVDYVRPRS